MLWLVPCLRIVWQSRGGGARSLVDAVIAGAREGAPDVDISDVPALGATVEDVLSADGLILATPEHFGYMSGALKHFFEEIYYPCLDRTRGRPYALVVKASTDGTGTVRAVQRIVAGLAWREIRPPLLVVGDVGEADLEGAWDLGASFAAGLAMGMY